MGMRSMAEGMSEADFETEVAKWTKILTENQRKVWRSCYARGHAASFVTASRASGATHALFVVNGHTAVPSTPPPPLATGGVDANAVFERKALDLARELTDRGTAQCMVARTEWFGRLPVKATILASPATRCCASAMHMSGQAWLT